MTKHATKVVADCDKIGICLRQLVAYIHTIPWYRQSGKTLEAFSPSRRTQARTQARTQEQTQARTQEQTHD
jgi:hypothetical protein